MRITGCTVAHRKDGKTTEEWFYVDNLTLMQQLGAVPVFEATGD